MHRFFCPAPPISGNKIIINDKEKIHHLRDVLRLKPGEKVVLFDGKGSEYITEIEKLSPQSILLKIKDRYMCQTTKKFRLTIACAIPKKSKMDDIIDKLTQLGVDRITPLETERVIIKLNRHKEGLRHERWKRIAISAAQQSQRNTAPIIEPIRDIKEVLSASGDFDLKLIPTLTGERKALREAFLASKPKNVLVLIGPEGDFTDEEVDLAKESGCLAVSLGDFVLRVETAAVAVAGFIRLLYENS